ncbi:hypothetical protein ACHAXT_003016 [Thalassiosira profunda]
MAADALASVPELAHFDKDTSEYILSILEDDPSDEDAREAVAAFIHSSVEDDNGEDVVAQFFAALDASLGDRGAGSGGNNGASSDIDNLPRKLDAAITLKAHDIQTFASGLVAATDATLDEGGETDIQSFYANMIDASDHPRAKSERERRKARQREMREKMEEQERKRAIEDALRMMEEGDGMGDEANEEMSEVATASDNAADVHFANFHLPNRKGGGPDLLTEANLTLARGRRYGLMGRNGCGKTTLLTALSARQLNDSVGGGVPKNMSMLLVRQEIMGNELSAVETVLKSDVKREGVKRWIEHVERELHKLDHPEDAANGDGKEEEEAKAPPSKGKQKLKDRKKNKAASAAKKTLTKKKSASEESVEDKRKALNAKLALWLERYLTRDFKGTLVVVSHDRSFLNEVVTDVVHFHRGSLTTYRGDISNFMAVREENRKRQIRLYEQQEAKRAHLQKYIDLHAQAGENGVKAARQRKSRMKKLDKLGVMAAGEGRKFKASYDGDAEEIEEFEEDEEVVLQFPDPGDFDGNMVTLDQVTFGYTSDKTLLEDVDLTIDMKSRVALLGRNGCGKSTLIKLIVGALSANKGKVSINGRAKIEYLAQHQLEQLDPDSCPMDTMLERYPGDMGNTHKGEIRRYLANFGLGGNDLPMQSIHTMSGGQKCRLCLALSMYRKPHLLILDEPTNHLDLETTEALINAIKDFPGGVLLVSHDQHLLTQVCKHLYVVDKGSVDLLKQGMTNGETFERYKKDVVAGRRAMASHQTIVVELGASRIKVGFAGESTPRRILSGDGESPLGGGWPVTLNDGLVSSACHWRVPFRYLSSPSSAATAAGTPDDGSAAAITTAHEWEKALYPLFSHMLTSILFVQRPSRHRVLVLTNDAFSPRPFREALHTVLLDYLGVGGVRLAGGGVFEGVHYLMEGMPAPAPSAGLPKAYLLVDIGAYEARAVVSVTGSSVLAETQHTTKAGYVSFLRQILANYHELNESGNNEEGKSGSEQPKSPVATLEDANAIVQAWAASSSIASLESGEIAVKLPSQKSSEGHPSETQLPTQPLLQAFHEIYLDFSSPSSLIFAVLSCAVACPIDYRKAALQNVILLGGGAVALRHFNTQGNIDVEGNSAKGFGMQLEIIARDAIGLSSDKSMEEGKEEEKKEDSASAISSIARRRFRCLKGAAAGSVDGDRSRRGGMCFRYPDPFAADMAAWMGGSILGKLRHKDYQKKL